MHFQQGEGPSSRGTVKLREVPLTALFDTIFVFMCLCLPECCRARLRLETHERRGWAE